MNKTFLAVVALAIASVLAGAWFYRQAGSDSNQQALELPETPLPPEIPDEPVIRYPVPPSTEAGPVPDEQASQQIEQQVVEAIDSPVDPASDEAASVEPALPELDASDKVLRDALADTVKLWSFESLFRSENIIRRFVVTIDNMPGRKLPQKHLIAEPTEGPFLTAGEEGEEYIDEENYRRYTPFVSFLESVDAQKIASIYIRFYPLFQAAYVDLGYPSAYFNDRLVEVIDHLLATPDVQGRVRLVRPHVLYKFANPELEALSAGQKVLLRIGYENAARVKTMLRELRAAVTVQEAAP